MLVAYFAALLLGTFDANERVTLDSGRDLFVVRPHAAPEHWFVFAETVGLVTGTITRFVMGQAYAPYGNMIFFDTRDGDDAENGDALREVLTYVHARYAKPIVVGYSSAAGVALQVMEDPAYASMCRLVVYSCGVGTDMRAQLARGTRWIDARVRDSAYSYLAPLVQDPFDAAVPSLQYLTHFELMTLFGGTVYKCLIAGVLCVEAVASASVDDGSLALGALGIHTRLARAASKALWYDARYRGWVARTEALRPERVSVPVVAIHGDSDKLFDAALTFASLGGVANCTVPRASHNMYSDNMEGSQQCIEYALTRATPV